MFRITDVSMNIIPRITVYGIIYTFEYLMAKLLKSKFVNNIIDYIAFYIVSDNYLSNIVHNITCVDNTHVIIH